MCATLSITDDKVLENTEMFSIVLVSNDTAAKINNCRSEIVVYVEEDHNESK